MMACLGASCRWPNCLSWHNLEATPSSSNTRANPPGQVHPVQEDEWPPLAAAVHLATAFICHLYPAAPASAWLFCEEEVKEILFHSLLDCPQGMATLLPSVSSLACWTWASVRQHAFSLSYTERLRWAWSACPIFASQAKSETPKSHRKHLTEACSVDAFHLFWFPVLVSILSLGPSP